MPFDRKYRVWCLRRQFFAMIRYQILGLRVANSISPSVFARDLGAETQDLAPET